MKVVISQFGKQSFEVDLSSDAHLSELEKSLGPCRLLLQGKALNDQSNLVDQGVGDGCKLIFFKSRARKPEVKLTREEEIAKMQHVIDNDLENYKRMLMNTPGVSKMSKEQQEAMFAEIVKPGYVEKMLDNMTNTTNTTHN